MAGLGRLIHQGVGDVGDIFCRQFDEYVVNYEELNSMKHGSNYYKPSGMYSCMRELYYIRCGVVGKEELTQQNISICANGSWRHETIQNYLIKMSEEGYGDLEWIDPEEYVKSNNLEELYGTVVKQRVGNEVKLFNKKYQMSFMCDGIVRFKGKIYILEIKTTASFIFSKLEDARPEHKIQATCYSMCLGIDDILFVYEDRGVLSHKGFHYKVSDSDKLLVANKIANCEEYLNNKELPEKEKDKCKYCAYKQQCRNNYNPRS